MIKQLQEKLNQSHPYTSEELAWLLDHIGDSDPAVRDNLVYLSFCHALLDGLVDEVQLASLLDETLARQLQTTGLGTCDERTLTRSFTSLLHTLLLYVDGQEGHPYRGWMRASQREMLWQLVLDYLPAERDIRGYDSVYGWVHAIAHGADFLQAVACHPEFPLNRLTDVWEVIKSVLLEVETTFSAGESSRLAAVLLQLLAQERLTQDQVAMWLSDLQVSRDEPSDYAKQLNSQGFLSVLYFHLEKEGVLGTTLKQALLNHPHLLA